MTEFKKWLDHNKLYLEAAYKVLDMEEYTLRAWERAQPQWQPCETAPKDGRSFLIKVGATVLISRYSDEFLVVTGDLPKGEHKWYWAEIPGMVDEDEEGAGCAYPNHPQVNGGN